MLIKKEKTKQTWLKNYGVGSPFQHKNIQEKKKQTMLNTYGVGSNKHFHMIDILPLIRDYNWLFDQYITQHKTATQISKELGITDVTVGLYLKNHKIDIRDPGLYSYRALVWLKLIEQQEGIIIQHALNGGEYSIPHMPRCRADGYCRETNTIYEFYGDYWHGNPKVFEDTVYNKSQNKTMGEIYQNTIIRENRIKELGYNLVTIWENEFLDLKEDLFDNKKEIE